MDHHTVHYSIVFYNFLDNSTIGSSTQLSNAGTAEQPDNKIIVVITRARANKFVNLTLFSSFEFAPHVIDKANNICSVHRVAYAFKFTNFMVFINKSTNVITCIERKEHIG